ncbi:Sporulation protein YtaF [Alkaliphilus metalliredigens QYMF]|uniref:Sporulation protein YtaF n=1 Tax=Alkaliphilus metalliredigens (strain QYMF) TaxID=293826 RepID=A6TW27_ALKMQ|nr:sporulation membrane protein YtaF [Alkaliphilus metalliredigens]ABR50395.1 Sporulation protein YtaF [Alkaliphilus metalliredigens QYMF]
MIEGILIAIAVSIDSLSVGVAYGIKKIKVPLHSLIVLDIISILLLSIGFFLGNMMIRVIPPYMTELIGASMLICLGIWLLLQGWLEYKFPRQDIKNPISIAIISIQSLGIAINIFRDPSQADLDTSGIIDTREAVLLGLALAIDSLAIGVAVSLNSISIILFTVVLVGILNLVFLLSGIYLGNKYLSNRFRQKTAFVPGCILILLGLVRLF